MVKKETALKEKARLYWNGVSPKAIEVYRGHLMQKMNAGNVVELVTQIAGCLRCTGHPVIRPPCLNQMESEDIVSAT